MNLVRIKELIEKFENKYEQGYVHVTFMSHEFNWGFVTWRKAMSGGADGECEFISLHGLQNFIEHLNGSDST